MAKLNDPTILGWIDAVLRERRCICYFHWERAAREEMERGAGLTPTAVEDALAEVVAEGERPDIEVQRDERFAGQDRYVWRIEVRGVKLYLKVKIELDHLDEPRIEVVRCHEGWY